MIQSCYNVACKKFFSALFPAFSVKYFSEIGKTGKKKQFSLEKKVFRVHIIKILFYGLKFFHPCSTKTV
jgi:hypothetical protein